MATAKTRKKTEQKDNGPSLREIRTEASLLGITTMGKDRYRLQKEIAAVKSANAEAAKEEEQKAAAATLELKTQLTQRGLSTDGTDEELKLRLASVVDGAITKADRNIYMLVAGVCIALGIMALAISVPHIAAELSELMNIHIGVAYLFAIVIDCGIVGLKAVDIVGKKFTIKQHVRYCVRGLLGMCLGFSVLLNASQFIRHLQSPGAIEIAMAVTCAVFIVSFVFLMFMVGSMMLTSCQAKKDSEEEVKAAEMTVADAFRNNAELWEALQTVAKTLPQQNS
jgi:hypothetical protein